MIKVVRRWRRLPREVVDASSFRAFQGQAEWCFEQLDLVEDVPAHSKKIRLDDL